MQHVTGYYEKRTKVSESLKLELKSNTINHTLQTKRDSNITY